MLFSSFPFIICFLPLYLYFLHRLSSSPAALSWLFLSASLLFYAFWGPVFLLPLLGLASLNYLFALYLDGKSPRDTITFKKSLIKISCRKLIFILAICLNLLPLLWFKYSLFIMDNLALLMNTDWDFNPPGLPLGISFYTFIQIAWLCDRYSGNAQGQTWRQHLLFSCGFPWLVSGPIVRAHELDKQLSSLSPLSAACCAQGFALFSIGLAKKLILADSCGLYADNVFNAAHAGWPLGFVESWGGSLFYTYQLYFDFSGYTDMALALGLLMGLRLPENFNSPYRASGIIDFWRRWHITLGIWLRDFIYIPLGGNRKGGTRQALNLFLTMLLGGIWHGAGWTYICWGAMHGFMLVVNHAWRGYMKRWHLVWKDSAFLKFFSIFFTFTCVNICWVIFRASNLDSAFYMYKAMFSLPIPVLVINGLSSFFANLAPRHYLSGWQPAFLLCLCALLCWTMPNSRQILSFIFHRNPHSPFLNRLWAFCFAFLAFLALLFSGRQASFLYFQF